MICEEVTGNKERDSPPEQERSLKEARERDSLEKVFESYLESDSK